MSKQVSFALSDNALEKLLGGDELNDDPMLLQVNFINIDDGYLAVDGSGKASRVKMLGRELQNDLYSIIFVRGFVVSTVNAVVPEPLLYITAYSVVEERSKPLIEPPSNMLKLNSTKTMGGNAYEFFSGAAHVLSNAALAGGVCKELSYSSSAIVDWKEKESVLSHFLEHDKAIKTLSSTQNSAFDHRSNTSECYMTAQSEFIASQLDRQKASLTSNTGRQDAETSAKIARQHAICLNMALEQDLHADLTSEILCKWHGVLCGDGLHRHAGILRPRGVHVRVGQLSFRQSVHIPEDIKKLCIALNQLEVRLLRGATTSQQVGTTSTNVSSGIAAVTFAAAVFFGIVDTHAFADGNGRLARVAANWALRRAGIPFCVHFFATPTQRKEYRDATVMTRRNLYLVPRGHVPQETLLEVYQDAKCLKPLVDLFMDRVYKAITEFSNLVKEKTAQLTDQDEAKAARVFRERAAAGNCFICFDENPNIATLCCGKAVHLNCMAEWLSSKNSCPQCRGDLPSLSQRLRAPEPNDADTTMEDSVELIDSTETTSTTDDEYTTVAVADDTTSDEDDTTTTTSVDAPMADATETTTTDDTTLISGMNEDVPPYCSYTNCHNRSARDCANGCCGRCCVLHGRFACPRHNVS